MANDTYEEAIEGLKKLLSEKNELEEVAAAKVRQLTAELAGAADKPEFDPVERIRTGFEHFKKENYECWNLLGIDNCEILGDAD